MPRSKQPTPLQKLAMDVLFEFNTSFCNKSIARDSAESFREWIAFMKKDVCPYVPWRLAPDFYERLFNEIFKDPECPRPKNFQSYANAAYEMIMDRKITGLRCVKEMLGLLNPDNVHRLRGLTELEIPETLKNLENTFHLFQLKDLTSLTYRCKCTDLDLEKIASNCPKLEHLDIRSSDRISDEGLRALSRCAKLRDLRVSRCAGISLSGINRFLSLQKNIRKLSAWARTDDAGFDCFSRADTSTYPTIHKFIIALDCVSNEHLQTVARKFPNLTSFGISGELVGDLSLLKNLEDLSQLDFRRTEKLNWENLKKLLTFIGSNISYLDVCTVTDDDAARGFATQSDLDFLFKFCENLECLKFVYRPPLQMGESLKIPAFEKLKTLQNYITDEHAWLCANVEFGQLSELRDLRVHRFDLTENQLESIIRDETCKFPKLEFMQLMDISCFYNIDYLNDIVRTNNIDLLIQDDN